MFNSYFPLLAMVSVMLGAARSCSYVRLPTVEGCDVIGRTMELGGGDNRTATARDPDPSTGWQLAVHPPDETSGSLGDIVCADTNVFVAKYGYVSIDSNSTGSLHVTTEGMNANGLTVSAHTLAQSVYQIPTSGNSTTGSNVCWIDFTNWVLGGFSSVAALCAALKNTDSPVRVVGARLPAPPSDLLHWAVDDAVGDHVVIEYLDGQLFIHNNTVGTMTNDPDYGWHLRNLNNFANVSPNWPAGGVEIGVETELGVLPNVVGHGFNLLGLPGDTSPPSRFIRLFYLKAYAVLNNKPKTVNETIALTSGILNTVFLPKGTVAKKTNVDALNYEFTQFSVLKLPQQRKFYFKDYDNTQWRMVRVDDVVAKANRKGIPLSPPNDLGIRDVTSDLLG
eukprot:m.73715 g.73715  ORF g.73715 m.73715 type:complete len:393 (-) comp24588_c1_seq1:214-1392(-)